MIYKVPIYFGGKEIQPFQSNDPETQKRLYDLVENYSPCIPIERVFDVDNDNQLWYKIPGFNGYEISDHGNVRSMKNFNVYPWGNLVRITRTGYCQLSTNQNMRVTVHVTDLWIMAMEFFNVVHPADYPHHTDYVVHSSRNKRCFIDFEKVQIANVPKSKKPRKVNKENLSFAHFTVKKDENSVTPLPNIEDE